MTEQVQHKVTITRQTKEEVNGILYPAQGTGARMVWDAADAAFDAGLTSSDVIEKITNETTMSAGTVSSQLTYWRKAVGKTLAKRASTAKAEKDADKAAAKAEREAERATKREAKEQDKAAKAKEKLAKLQAEADKLKVTTEQTTTE